jgi:capsular polysaccharide biosynthesis protein
MVTWSEVQSFIRIVLRWWWISVLAVLTAGGVAYAVTGQQQPTYTANATLMVGDSLLSTQPAPSQLEIEKELLQFYSELAHREPILGAVQASLGLDFPWQTLRDTMVRTRIVSNASLLEIIVSDTNPVRAAAIANAIGDHLIAFSPTSPEKIAAERQVIENQMRTVEKRINKVAVEIEALTERRDRVTSAIDLADINQKLEQLEIILRQEQSTYNTLLAYRQSSTTNSLKFFEQAKPASFQLPSRRMATIGVAVLGALLFSILTIVFIERTGNRWKDAQDLAYYFNITNLGSIPTGPPIATVSQEMRLEREQALEYVYSNILLNIPQRRNYTLLLSSPHNNDNRAQLASDLSHLFVRAGCKVLIIDGDRVQLPNGSASQPALAEIAPSLRWPDLIQQLRNAADVIIFDGPTVLNNADAALLAPHVDGVILVVSPALDTRADVAKSIQQLLRQQPTPLVGSVILEPQEQHDPTVFSRRFWAPKHLQPTPTHLADLRKQAAISQSTAVRRIAGPSPTLPLPRNDSELGTTPEQLAGSIPAPQASFDANDLLASLLR